MDEIKKLIRKCGSDKVKLLVLIDLGDGLDDDLEAYPIVADVMEIIDDDVFIYDECYEDENGIVDAMFKTNLGDLSQDIQKSAKFALEYTLSIINK